MQTMPPTAAEVEDRVKDAWDDIDCGIIDADELRGVLAKLGCDDEVDADELFEQLDVEDMGVVEFEDTVAWFLEREGLEPPADNSNEEETLALLDEMDDMDGDAEDELAFLGGSTSSETSISTSMVMALVMDEQN